VSPLTQGFRYRAACDTQTHGHTETDARTRACVLSRLNGISS